MKTLTKKEIILETVEYYKKNPRAVGKENCEYFIDGNMCAVGRCLIDAENFEKYNIENKCTGLTINDFRLSRRLEDELRPEYRGHSITFWTDLQILHDMNSSWIKGKDKNINDLSTSGEYFLKNLEEKYF